GLTKVYYNLPKKEVAILKVYNTLGNLVYSAKSDKGEFTIKKLPAGIYLLRFESASGGYKEDRKLIVVK
ncbi:MAG: T9SS type A sorting domain-containing protein, partial [candidate division WOR-3 bacterium]